MFAVVLFSNALGQNKYFGKVVDVLDGKTIVIEPQPKVQIKIELQFIEIPEVEQPLHTTVKDHLSNMVLGKIVEFEPQNLNNAKPIGKVLLNGVDVSQQMLRDGAAWYAVNEQKYQNASQSQNYLSNEDQAKAEKRGVWSIPDLKPAWEYRAAKEEEKRQAELKKQAEENERQAKIREEAKAKEIERRKAQAKSRAVYGASPTGGLGIESWQDSTVSGMNAKVGYPNLLTKYFPEYEVEYTLSVGEFYQFKNGKNEIKVESRSMYVKPDKNNTRFIEAFGIGFLGESEKGVFAKISNITITADKKVIKLPVTYYGYSDVGGWMKELVICRIPENSLRTISEVKVVKVKIGNYEGLLSKNYQSYIAELVAASK